ncbi:ABC transporter ATP-binding protein [Succinimonas sp.]|uniref:ABC transporter ATP-binding protein n=1 Tax=Succinimonas sp. TaxID=1936151 RepID=UPI0038658BA1
MTDDTYVELSHVNKSFGNFRASDDVSFRVAKGSLVGLLGPSGSGKTTILRILAGLENADSGEIYIGGRLVNGVPASKRGIGFVFQSYALFRYMSVFDNVAFGLTLKKVNKIIIKEKVMNLIELVGLRGLENRYPSQLSGGQRQRVAFARALATEPSLLLLDEPFAAIDAKVRKELRGWLKNLIHSVGITSIFVTHDQDEAIEVADQIIVTNHGRIEQSGPPQEIFYRPETSFVARFIGNPTLVEDVSLFSGFDRVERGSSGVVRPEFIEAAREDEAFQYSVTAEKGVVEDVFFRGDSLELKVRVKGGLLTVFRQITRAPVAVGETLRLFISRFYVVRGDSAVMVVNDSLNPEQRSYVI